MYRKTHPAVIRLLLPIHSNVQNKSEKQGKKKTLQEGGFYLKFWVGHFDYKNVTIISRIEL